MLQDHKTTAHFLTTARTLSSNIVHSYSFDLLNYLH